jgi:hypothetical protein
LGRPPWKTATLAKKGSIFQIFEKSKNYLIRETKVERKKKHFALKEKGRRVRRGKRIS